MGIVLSQSGRLLCPFPGAGTSREIEFYGLACAGRSVKFQRKKQPRLRPLQAGCPVQTAGGRQNGAEKHCAGVPAAEAEVCGRKAASEQVPAGRAILQGIWPALCAADAALLDGHRPACASAGMGGRDDFPVRIVRSPAPARLSRHEAGARSGSALSRSGRGPWWRAVKALHTEIAALESMRTTAD